MAPHKTAKKHAAKHTGPGKHGTGNEIRRAYEHLGRLEALQGGLPPATVDSVRQLSEIAQRVLEAGNSAGAADLLRAAEHLSFASLAATNKERIDRPGLAEALETEFEHLRQRADDHWDDGSGVIDAQIGAIYRSARTAAGEAMDAGSYRRAMESIRAAEALSRVDTAELKTLSSGATTHRLKG